MSMKCQNCGKGVQHGNFVSHAKNRVKRTFKPNLHRVTIVKNNVKQRLMLCASCTRLLKRAAFA
ncbi:MAG: 50S ribosomal protein L28 [Patescibacteria group bacterium]|nr:50S ribosomal protein L28 [Patescibacteria group bacterium]MDZ4228998.1 50S ribosomal protein L28 [Patescibacteria group bacterium]